MTARELVQVEPYVDPGHGRRRRGTGWSYFDRGTGETVREAPTLLAEAPPRRG